MKMKVIMVLMVILFLVSTTATISPVKAASKTWTVDDDGADFPSADFTHPQDAVNAASPGDTILVYPGTYGSRVYTTKPPHWSVNDQYAPALIVYKEDLTIKAVDPDPSKTVIETTHDCWSNPVAIQASTGGVWDGTKYVGAGVNPDDGTAPSAVIILADGVTLEGFTIQSTARSFNSWAVIIGGLFSGDRQFLGVSGVTVKNNVLTNSWEGLRIWHSSNNMICGNVIHDVDFRGIEVYDGWSDDDISIGYHSQNNKFIRNEFYNCRGGIYIGSYLPSIWSDNSGTVISKNNFHDIPSFGWAIGGSESYDFKIYGNVHTNCVYAGVTFTWWSSAYGGVLHDSVITMNKITNCSVGYRLGYLRDSEISRNKITGAGSGSVYDWPLELKNSDHVYIRCNKISDNERGIIIEDSTDVGVYYNLIFDNGEDGIRVISSSGVVLYRNVVERNGGNGISVNDTTDFKIYRNIAIKNGRNGIKVENSDDGVIKRNVALRNGEYDLWWDSIGSITWRRNVYRTKNW